MATIPKELHPEVAQYMTTAFPQYTRIVGTNFPYSALAYDAAADWAAFWKFRASNYGSGNLTVAIDWEADTASTGSVVWEVQIAAITPDTDTQDMETKALGTLNFVQDAHLGTTGQRAHRALVTVSNLDSLAADDLLFIRIARDANGTNATDDMAGFALLTLATVLYSDT